MIVLLILTIIALVSLVVHIKTDDIVQGLAAAGVLTTLFGACSIVYFFNFDPDHLAKVKAQEEAEAAQRREQETPHVVREADGCKVYTFLVGDRYHFFTRCPDGGTVTDTSWDECHMEKGVGKSYEKKCVTKSESIETTNK